MEKKWWHGKTAYQIYPKSFYDSNGDGIGDLQGIIRKLDYLKELGVDIIWLSPIYVSPLADEGYDIADYYAIDPRFGTMDDLDQLISEVHKRGQYIIMDLVVNHCSDEHEWFRKACEDPEGKYGRYFYIEKTDDPKTLCNWRSYFGGSVWEKLPGHDDYYYLHMFHKKQPDLNWENPQMREDIYSMVNWWLDKGIDGFRLDAIINIKKGPFVSYPPDRDDGLVRGTRQLEDARGIGEFLGELRDRCFAPHNAFTVGEVFNLRDDEIKDFIGDNGYFSSMFDFTPTVFGQDERGWQYFKDVTPDDYRSCVFKGQKEYDDIGFVSNLIENHDEPRGVSRYIPEGDQSPVSKKMLAALYFLTKGLPWIYQGQELGMENEKLSSIDQVDDISSIDAYKVAVADGVPASDALHLIEKYGRDNARTPFQWSSEKNAGFSTGKPWLAPNPNYTEINLAAEKSDPDSVFNFYRKLIKLRKSPEYSGIFVYGDFSPYLPDTHNCFSYTRSIGGRTVLVIANYQNEGMTCPLPAPVRKVLLTNTGSVSYDSDSVSLDGYQVVVAEI